jgi:hypothetical protein
MANRSPSLLAYFNVPKKGASNRRSVVPTFLGNAGGTFFGSLLIATTIAHPSPSLTLVLDDFASAWSTIGSYSATLTMHETEGTNAQDRTCEYTFAKPSTATVAITAGPDHGGRVTWSGSDDVTGSPPGLLRHQGASHLSLHDRRVTTLRGDTVAMASFGWLLGHDPVSWTT